MQSATRVPTAARCATAANSTQHWWWVGSLRVKGPALGMLPLRGGGLGYKCRFGSVLDFVSAGLI